MAISNRTDFYDEIREQLYEPLSSDAFEKHMDKLLASSLYNSANTLLAKGRINDKHGWWDENVVTQEELVAEMMTALHKGEMREVALYSGMLMAKAEIARDKSKDQEA